MFFYNLKLFSFFLWILLTAVLNAQIPENVILQSVKEDTVVHEYNPITPVTIDHMNTVSEPIEKILYHHHYLFLDSKNKNDKTNISFHMREYEIKIGYPADYKGIRSAIGQFNKTYFFVQVAGDPLTRGIWLDKSTEIWTPSFYLFSHNVNENYLAWTRRFGIQFKEITISENPKKLLETELKKEDLSIYSIPINNMEWSIYLLASIDEKIDNLEIVDITNEKNNTLNVTVRSKLTGTEFSMVPDMQVTMKQLNIHNKKYQTHLKIPPPSIISWQFSKDSIKAAKKFIEDGFHFWATNDYETNLIAKPIEIKNDCVILETLQGKQVTLKINTLIQRDQDYIKERKKN
jgi:hypothetical protein